MVNLSLLELAIITSGNDTATAIDSAVKTAQHVEKLNFKRVWLAEHHNMPNVASSATVVLIGHIAEKTNKIRVGSGGIMLPNHSPLIVAEQFGTLDALYPNRIDLGLGRAPGTDQVTAYAIRKENIHAAFHFQDDIKALQNYFGNTDESAKVRAFPGEGANVPLYVLGSSSDSAYLAAGMGLPYAFAAHFAPKQLYAAIDIYRKNFRPSAYLNKPKVIVCVNVIGADSDEEAEFLSSSLVRMYVGILTNQRQPMMPAHELPAYYFEHPQLKHLLDNMLGGTFIGGKEKLKKELGDFLKKTQADELMTTAYLYDHETKLKSLTILREAIDDL